MPINISTKFHACIRMCMIIVISRSTIMYSVDHNHSIFSHVYCTDNDNLSNLWNTMLKYQYF